MYVGDYAETTRSLIFRALFPLAHAYWIKKKSIERFVYRFALYRCSTPRMQRGSDTKLNPV